MTDPRRNQGMIEEEEKAQDYFEDAKDMLELFSVGVWIDQFQKCVEDFIQERLSEAMGIMASPGTEDSVRLHGLRRLVAGAVQEGELVRQPEYATTSAKLDRAIIWQGRGYVVPTNFLLFRLKYLPRVNLRKFRQLYGW
jgi:hypothetical protein